VPTLSKFKTFVAEKSVGNLGIGLVGQNRLSLLPENLPRFRSVKASAWSKFVPDSKTGLQRWR